jgi:hypothetical protein
MARSSPLVFRGRAFELIQERPVAAHDSPAYREALKALGDACERDVRIVEGVD